MTETVDKKTWLSQKKFATKYSISVGTVIRWRKLGYLSFEEKRLPNNSIGYILPDLPPHKHPGYKKKPQKRASRTKNALVTKKHISGKEEIPENIKTSLSAHLKVFTEKAPAAQMFFTGPELVDLLGVNVATVYKTWKSWGLKRYNVPGKSKIGGDKARSADYVYTRIGLVNFFSGKWGEEDSADDILISKILGTGEGSNTGYYQYNTQHVYPFSGEGVIQWIKDKKLMREDKRLNKWVPIKLWPYQVKFIKEAFGLRENGDYQHNMIVASWERGEGKCESKGTELVMHDGTCRKVEDIIVGDKMMGPDSRPRNVIGLGRGQEEMFEVTPFKGEPFTVNKSHILPLVIRKQKWVYSAGEPRKKEHWYVRDNISVGEYLKKNPDYKNNAYCFRATIDFPYKDVFDPYLVGLWLGDGTTIYPEITNNDQEIIDYIYLAAGKMGLDITLKHQSTTECKTYRFVGTGVQGGNKLLNELKVMDLIGNKHIPQAYKSNSKKVRMQILAGIIDTDGTPNRSGYVVTQKSKVLAEDIVFLARSLGFCCYINEFTASIKSIGFKGQYYKVGINGNCSEIPVRVMRKVVPKRIINKDVSRTRIKSIESKGVGDYYGVSLDGDHLYIRKDFMVSHNTFICMLLFLFRFFNRYGEIINLSGLSKDQSSFAHYNLAKKTILNTPALHSTPGLDVKEKEIVLLRGPNDPVCQIKAVPTSTGLLPGTTCAVFTELHKLQDRQFFIDLWTSIRATPNAMVLIDTTVAAKGHIVHGLWESYCKGDDPLLYFNHKQDNIQNPETTLEQLASFRKHMLPFEFNRYFRNRWEDAVGGLFTPASIKKTNYLGIKIDNVEVYGKSDEMDNAIEELIDGEGQRNLYRKTGIADASLDNKMTHVSERLIKVDDVYSIPATAEDKEKLEGLMGGPMTIGLGLDRSKLVGNMPDRTVLLCLGKIQIDFNTAYYFILDVFVPSTPTSMFLQNKLIEWELQYGYIDKVVSEEYQSQDFHLWCDEHGYESEFCSPTFKRQEEIFTKLFEVVNEGYFKTPEIPYYMDSDGSIHEGYSNKDDILVDEFGAFLHDGDRRFFGAPEKRKKAAIKDDVIYSLAWATRACQCESMGEFTKGSDNFVTLLEEPDDLVGEY
jgi:hypothetical protein